VADENLSWMQIASYIIFQGTVIFWYLLSLNKKPYSIVAHIQFEQILENNKTKIFRICRIYGVTPLEPEDLFQEVVYQIWKSLSSFQGNSSVDTWVYRITLNVCMRSKLKLERDAFKTARFEGVEFKISENNAIPEEERYLYLKQCIAELNEADTSIIVLYLEALSYKEIASITGLTENHVAVKMKRIRKKLFECINAKTR